MDIQSIFVQLDALARSLDERDKKDMLRIVMDPYYQDQFDQVYRDLMDQNKLQSQSQSYLQEMYQYVKRNGGELEQITPLGLGFRLNDQPKKKDEPTLTISLAHITCTIVSGILLLLGYTEYNSIRDRLNDSCVKPHLTTQQFGSEMYRSLLNTCDSYNSKQAFQYLITDNKLVLIIMIFVYVYILRQSTTGRGQTVQEIKDTTPPVVYIQSGIPSRTRTRKIDKLEKK